MDGELTSDLLERATAAYRRVVADPETFGPDAARLVAEAREAGDAAALVAALRAYAWFERISLGHVRALVLLDEAREVARRKGLNTLLGQVLLARGTVNHELGRLAAARRDFDRAAALDIPELAAELAHQRAALYQNMGRLSDAARLYRRVLADPDTPPGIRAKVANNLGIIEAQRGRPEAALALFNQAVPAAEQVGPAGIAMLAEGRAWVTVQAGRLTEGLRLFDEAAQLWERAGLPLGELYAEYADALVDLRLVPEATQHAERALRMLDEQGVHLMAAEAELRVARLAQLTNRLTVAVTAADSAAARLRQQGRASWAARAQLVAVDARLQAGASIPADLTVARRAARTLARAGMVADAAAAYLSAGRVARALGRTRVAQDAWTTAYELSRQGPVLVRLKGRLAAALAARLQQRHDVVAQHARRGLADLARHRTSLASPELRALASGHGAELGSLGLASVVQTRSAARVLTWMERTRAAALAVVDPPAVEGIEEDLAALRAVQAELLAVRREPGAKPAELVRRQAAVEDRIRRASWQQQLSAEASGAILSPGQLQARLDGQILVEYDVLDGVVLAAVVEPRRTRIAWLGPVQAVRHEVDALLFALRRLARGDMRRLGSAARRSADHSLAKLAELLIAPLGLPEHAGLVVVPVGQLQRIPWSAVHARPVSIAPSASLWARSRSQPRSAADVVLVAGPELPGASAEVHSLRTLHERPTVLVPPDSRVDAVTRALGGAGLAHLACHGYVRADNPTFSSLLLSDGELTVQELIQRGIAPYRIVLAACESGTEAIYEGNETLGFVSSLLARGTAGLVASAVVVPDWNVLALMRSLHEQVRRGCTLADALHAARGGLDREDPESFVSWCAFNAFGAA